MRFHQGIMSSFDCLLFFFRFLAALPVLQISGEGMLEHLGMGSKGGIPCDYTLERMPESKRRLNLMFHGPGMHTGLDSPRFCCVAEFLRRNPWIVIVPLEPHEVGDPLVIKRCIRDGLNLLLDTVEQHVCLLHRHAHHVLAECL